MAKPAENVLRFDPTHLHGGLYVVRENPNDHTLLRPPRRLVFAEHHIAAVQNARSVFEPVLHIRVNPDWTMTVLTTMSRRGKGKIEFPSLRLDGIKHVPLGEHVLLQDFTILGMEKLDLVRIQSPSARSSLTRIVFVDRE